MPYRLNLSSTFLLPSCSLHSTCLFTSLLTSCSLPSHLSCLLPEFFLSGSFHHCSLSFQLLEWTQSQEAGQSSSTIHTEVSFKQSSAVPLFHHSPTVCDHLSRRWRSWPGGTRSCRTGWMSWRPGCREGRGRGEGRSPPVCLPGLCHETSLPYVGLAFEGGGSVGITYLYIQSGF